MGFLDRVFGKPREMKTDDPGLDRIVQKLVSRDDTTFGEGLTEVLAIPESDPTRLRIIREAIRLRSGGKEVRFYEPNVGGLAVRDGNELLEARDRILSFAKESSLLADPQVAGSAISAFTTIGGFDAVVKLAYDIRDVVGIDQFQAFQLLYNQNRSAVVLQTSRGEKTWTQQTDQVSRFKPDKLVKDHFNRVKATLTKDRSAEWTSAVIHRIMDRELRQICLLAHGKMSESLRDGERHSASVLVEDFFVSISTFACSVEEARRKHYPDGYLPYLDRMVNMGRQENPRCHWLHFQFFWDGNIFWFQLTLFPNKNVLDFSPRYLMPIELLSYEEKRSLGLK